jgi:hypothetical protein
MERSRTAAAAAAADDDDDAAAANPSNSSAAEGGPAPAGRPSKIKRWRTRRRLSVATRRCRIRSRRSVRTLNRLFGVMSTGDSRHSETYRRRTVPRVAGSPKVAPHRRAYEMPMWPVGVCRWGWTSKRRHAGRQRAWLPEAVPYEGLTSVLASPARRQGSKRRLARRIPTRRRARFHPADS